MFDVLLLNRYVAYRFFFSRNKYIDIELPSLICTVSVFTLGTTLSPYNSLHAYTNTRAHGSALSLSFFFFFFLDPAISRASCASFVLLVPHTRACIYSYARLVSHSRNERSYNNSCPVRPFFFSLLFFSTTIIAWNRTRPVRPSRSSLPSRIKCYILAINNLLSLCRARWTNLRDVEPPSRAGRGWIRRIRFVAESVLIRVVRLASPRSEASRRVIPGQGNFLSQGRPGICFTSRVDDAPFSTLAFDRFSLTRPAFLLSILSLMLTLEAISSCHRFGIIWDLG